MEKNYGKFRHSNTRNIRFNFYFLSHFNRFISAVTLLKIILLLWSIISCIIIFHMKTEIEELRYSRDLWKNHSERASNYRINNYRSDYSYLTTGTKSE